MPELKMKYFVIKLTDTFDPETMTHLLNDFGKAQISGKTLANIILNSRTEYTAV